MIASNREIEFMYRCQPAPRRASVEYREPAFKRLLGNFKITRCRGVCCCADVGWHDARAVQKEETALIN